MTTPPVPSTAELADTVRDALDAMMEHSPLRLPPQRRFDAAVSALAVLEERATQAEARAADLEMNRQAWHEIGEQAVERTLAAEERATQAEAERDLAKRQMDRHAEGWNEAERNWQLAEARADRLEAALRKIETGYTRIARALPHGGSL